MRMKDALREASQAGGEPGQRARSFLTLLLRGILCFYIVFLSPFLGGACKFYPSCSNYAWEAIERHGPGKGALLAAKRLLRCHPFTRGGIDLVPEEIGERSHCSVNAPGIGGRPPEAMPAASRAQGEVL